MAYEIYKEFKVSKNVNSILFSFEVCNKGTIRNSIEITIHLNIGLFMSAVNSSRCIVVSVRTKTRTTLRDLLVVKEEGGKKEGYPYVIMNLKIRIISLIAINYYFNFLNQE